METKIDTKVTLYDADGKRIGETFSRRARQLVKQQRALWTDETHTAIRFLPDAAEEWEAETDGIPTAPNPSGTDKNEIPPHIDANLYALAKKRISTRRRMFWHTLGLLPGYLFLAALFDSMFTFRQFELGFFVGITFTLWTMSFAYTIHQFRKYNRGFFLLAEMETRRARKLANEMDRLKRMGYGG
ncbi:MAG: hypothetical protein FWE90_01440 [Defluviitaleaceae bacterium]|nr:hypothetical protein [Defluviitaleaceae bacterium]